MKNMRGVAVLMLIAMILVCGCGKKGPPVAPSGPARPKPVVDLREVIDGSTLNLVWTIPHPVDETIPPLDGFIMYRYREPITRPGCKECPIPFKALADIPIVKKGPGDKMIYREKLVQGFRYFYQVRGYRGQEKIGKASNIVQFQF